MSGVGAKVVSVSGDPAAVAARLNRSSLVQYAEPNLILKVDAVPNDPRFGELYGMDRDGIDAPEGWDAAGLGAFPATGGVKIGIVDTGIDQTHPDLSGQTVACAKSQGLLPIMSGSIQVGSCADDNDHGSHVAGTIAAKANNGIGVAGVAFNADLVICKALGGPLGTGSTADVANCINWVASQGAQVISMSLGGGASTTLQQAVASAWNNGNGALIVAAAGNDGDSTLNYPAALRGGGLGRRDRLRRRSRELLQRERRRRGRGSRRERAVDRARRRLRDVLGHLDGHAARVGGRRRAAAGVPGGQRRRDPQPLGRRGQRPRAGRPRRELRLRSREPL